MIWNAAPPRPRWRPADVQPDHIPHVADDDVELASEPAYPAWKRIRRLQQLLDTLYIEPPQLREALYDGRIELDTPPAEL